MRKCYRCGRGYPASAAQCEHCAVSLSILDVFQVWRRLRRLAHPVVDPTDERQRHRRWWLTQRMGLLVMAAVLAILLIAGGARILDGTILRSAHPVASVRQPLNSVVARPVTAAADIGGAAYRARQRRQSEAATTAAAAADSLRPPSPCLPASDPAMRLLPWHSPPWYPIP